MVVSKSSVGDCTETPFTSNGTMLEHIDALEYLRLHSSASGSISHLITPLIANVVQFWAAVHQKHSQLRCGNKLTLPLQSILVLLCITDVICGGCIAPLVQQRLHTLLFSSSVTSTSGTLVELCVLHLVPCCWRS